MSKIYVIGSDRFGGALNGNPCNYLLEIVTSEEDAQLIMEKYVNDICSKSNLHTADEETYGSYPKIVRKDRNFIKISETGYANDEHICFYYDEYEL